MAIPLVVKQKEKKRKEKKSVQTLDCVYVLRVLYSREISTTLLQSRACTNTCTRREREKEKERERRAHRPRHRRRRHHHSSHSACAVPPSLSVAVRLLSPPQPCLPACQRRLYYSSYRRLQGGHPPPRICPPSPAHESQPPSHQPRQRAAAEAEHPCCTPAMATTATSTRFTDEYQLYEELGK